MLPSDRKPQGLPVPVDLGMVRELKRYYPDVYFNAIRLGMASACYQLGMAYLPGGRIAENQERALYWLKIAAEKGDPMGCLAYGVLLSEEEGGYGAALPWYLEAARHGVPQAQYNLGVLYDNGLGVACDKKAAFTWYLEAARQGYENAMCNVGVMYYSGDGVALNLKEAFHWLRKAAIAGCRTAQSNVATMYLSGTGVPADHNKAFYWFSLAAEAGDHFAQHHLAQMLYQGMGTKKNPELGTVWLKRSARGGYQPAQEALLRLEQR